MKEHLNIYAVEVGSAYTADYQMSDNLSPIADFHYIVILIIIIIDVVVTVKSKSTE